jgi:hypothetical protein
MPTSGNTGFSTFTSNCHKLSTVWKRSRERKALGRQIGSTAGVLTDQVHTGEYVHLPIYIEQPAGPYI